MLLRTPPGARCESRSRSFETLSCYYCTRVPCCSSHHQPHNHRHQHHGQAQHATQRATQHHDHGAHARHQSQQTGEHSWVHHTQSYQQYGHQHHLHNGIVLGFLLHTPSYSPCCKMPSMNPYSTPSSQSRNLWSPSVRYASCIHLMAMASLRAPISIKFWMWRRAASAAACCCSRSRASTSTHSCSSLLIMLTSSSCVYDPP